MLWVSRERSVSVLLVEDDFLVRKITMALLTALNCQVAIAENAARALAKAKEAAYELIFLDIGLPDRSGDEVAREIRQDTNGCNQSTPIVAVTAHVDHENK